MHTSRHQNGFSLLEAIVAMTIMATCLLALYAWLSTSTLALNRVRANAQALSDARAALAIISTVNPMQTPSGRRTVTPLEVRWTSRPLTDLRLGMSPAGSATPFDFRLFEMTVEVRRGNAVVRAFEVRKVGWVVARQVSTDDL